ncbi:hypothetical protein [Agrobacterium tumefaciens]|uniref:hypothetical protein n=1 Tax=Agrobacterium tumefaciens TaxID=358 RepID=UPI0021D352CB|nr:hypothetical protein [Agrobacterium tumefaciens]UXS01098.1 hypothetical protein FY156_06125 [Agrobacterium tumefaciens]
MTDKIPNQRWDVYIANPDSEDQFRGKAVLADPARPLPDEVLRNFTIDKEDELVIITDPLMRDYQMVAAHGFVLSTIE